MWDPKMTYRSIHQLRQWKNARIDPEDVPGKTAICCRISHCPCVIYQRVDPPWAAFASRGNVAARLVSFLMPGTFGMAKGILKQKRKICGQQTSNIHPNDMWSYVFFLPWSPKIFHDLPGTAAWVNFADLGTQKIALPALRSSVIRTSNRDGGEPFKALVPDCSIPESLGETCARHGGNGWREVYGEDELFFFGKGGRNWQNPSNVSIIFDLHNVGILWNIWLSENGLIWIKYSELTTNVRTEVIGRNWRNHPHVPNIWGLWTKRFEDAWGILILGLKPPTCRWFISDWKNAGYSRCWNMQPCCPSAWNCIWPQKNHFVCVVCADTVTGPKVKETLDSLVQAHKDWWYIVTYYDRHGPLRIKSQTCTQRSNGWFYQPRDRETSLNHPKLMATTILPLCSSPGEMLVDCLGSEALPWRISWIRPLDEVLTVGNCVQIHLMWQTLQVGLSLIGKGLSVGWERTYK